MIRRLVLLGFISIGFSVPAHATKSYWFGSYLASGNTGAPRFCSPQGHSAACVATETSALNVVVGGGGTVTALYVSVSVDPGASTEQWTIAVRADAGAGSGMNCVIKGDDSGSGQTSATTCAQTSTTQALTGSTSGALHSVGLSIVPANTPASAQISWMMEYDSTIANESIIMGNSAGGATSTTADQAGTLGFVGAPVAIASDVQRNIVFPASFTITDLCVSQPTAPGAGTTRAFAPTLDGTIQADPIVSYADAETGTKCDTASLAAAAGNTTSMGIDVTGTVVGSICSWSIAILAGTAGNFFIPSNNAATMDQTNTTEGALQAIMTTTVTAGDAGVQTYIGAASFQFTLCYVQLDGTPGSGNDYTFKLRDDANDAASPFTVTISDAETEEASSAGSFTPTAGHFYNWQATPNSTPTARRAVVSYLGNVAAASTRPACFGMMMGVGKGGC